MDDNFISIACYGSIVLSSTVHSRAGEKLHMFLERQKAELFLDPRKSVSKPDGPL